MNKASLVLILLSVALFAVPSLSRAENLYEFTVKTIDGEGKNLVDYKGKVLLIVNTASRCGFTPQYKGLEVIYQQFKAQGFEVLAFPSNDFNEQEPGNNGEIKQFCELKYKTTFPLFAKINVKGENIASLYQFLTAQEAFKGAITWNFNKFLVDREGKVIARFDSTETPESEAIVNRIKEALSLKG